MVKRQLVESIDVFGRDGQQVQTVDALLLFNDLRERRVEMQFARLNLEAAFPTSWRGLKTVCSADLAAVRELAMTGARR